MGLGSWIGRELAIKVRSRRAARLDAERSAKVDAWAGKHRVLSTFASGLIFAAIAWWMAERRDGSTLGEILVWELVLVPAGLISAWIACTRIRRRALASTDRKSPHST
ncbi:hypothetical protein SD37_20530 [Amycolatopsis orientalis]|uniref:Uncharacterized protein n=1 Tax=Amycolatopsis orientalis TaxID=31958 RepID=A0A193C053_AMYOR|nr:hypothetical protein [Amycolatopsis orientalis]ANN17799.1 hypothetical protein SD37_20530 [Amycolatopsis orientalis]